MIVNSAVGYSSIYNNKANVKKGKFYEIWSRNEREINTLGAVDKEIHAKKRKILTQVFSDRSVQSAEAFVISHVDRWCDIMLDGNGKDWSTSRNMADWCDYLVFDILGDLCFGRSFESTQAEGKRFREIIASINKYMAFMYPVRRTPLYCHIY